MKKNKSKKVDEGFLDALIGDTGAAGLKSMFKGGMTGQAQLAQDLFIKDFVGDAVSSLNAGIKGGFINPGIRGGTTPPVNNNGANPPTGAGPAPAAPGAEKTSTPPQQYMGKIAPNVRAATKPTAAPNPLRAPVVPQKKTITARPNPNSMPGGITKGGISMKSGLKENSYHKLNELFESIMEATGGQSIAAYMEKWFSKYMGGVDWATHGAAIKPLIQNIQDTYSKDKGVAAIRKLANAAFAVAKASDVTPDGAKNIPVPGNPAKDETVEQLKTALEKLSKEDPAAYNNLIKTLRPAS